MGTVAEQILLKPLWEHPKLDLSGCVYNAQFWRVACANSPFLSQPPVIHTCTATGTTWTPPQGRSFDANDDYITIPHATPIDDLSELTWEAWINPSGNADRFVDKEYKGFRIAAGKLVGFFYAEAGGTNASSTDGAALTLNVWTHVALTYSNSGDRKIYLWRNGATVSSYTSQVAMVGVLPADAAYNLIVGSTAGATSDYGGYIGEVRIYSRVLTAPEIMNNYLGTRWRYAA